MSAERFNLKDLGAGAFFVAVGCLYLYMALKTLPIGRALEMGPGYFPALLASVLIFIGALLVIRGLLRHVTSPFGMVPWRAVVMLSLATTIFATLLNQLGLLVATFVTSLIASLSSGELGFKGTVAVCASIAAFCTAIFGYGIRLPIPIIGTWFVG